MKITGLWLKNFGRFTDKKLTFTDGINIVYGENEAGKSTVHTFIKGMLFGMERGRGRAASGDTFSLYEPWENPGYYAGTLTFCTGGKNFFIERNFDRHSRRTRIFCEDDGEELSAQDGDLEMLLDGLTSSGYDNTISVAQMKVRPGESLASELKNYATNYYVTGDSDLNLEKALSVLRERKKEAERAIRRIAGRKQEERDRLELEASFVWRDIHRLTQEKERLEEEAAYRREKEEKDRQAEPEVKGVIDEIRPPRWRIHPLEILAVIAAVVGSFALIPRPFNYFITVVIFLCGLIYIWNRMKVGKKKEKTEPELLLEEITPEENKIPLEQLLWEIEHDEEELRDKKIQYDNLKEQLEELDETAGDDQRYEEQKNAVQLAAERLEELSAKMQTRLRDDLNVRMSEIIAEITRNRYKKLTVGEGLSLGLVTDERRIPLEQVSRGTMEQVYFAFRMAAGEILHQEEYPLIFDDTFVCYDDARLEQTIAWLCKNKKQVLIFTCQRREEEALKRLGLPYTKEVL